MFNYKRLTFIFVFLTVVLISTDSTAEKQLRKSLLSFFDIVVEESSQVSDSAPSSFIDMAESTRLSIFSFFSSSSESLSTKADSQKGILSLLLSISSYVLLLLKYISNYVITFYPAILAIFYFFLTSRFFKKDEFGYNNF